MLEWPIDYNPPGGFVSYLQNPQYGPLNFPFHQNFGSTQQYAENFYFTGATSNHVPFSPPQPPPTHRTPLTPMAANRTPPTTMADSNIGSPSYLKKKAQVQLKVEDSDDGELARTEKHLKWTEEEEIRLVSCWLNGSNDPIDGNNKKVEQYWEEVTAAYNSTSPKNWRRESSQLKLHWHSMKTKINNFNGCWKCVNAVYQSGMSDDQRMENAMKKYRADFKETFKLVDMWKVLRDEQK